MTWRYATWQLALILCAGMISINGCKSDNTGQGTPIEDEEPQDEVPEGEDGDEEEDNSPPSGFLSSCESDKDCDSGLCIDNLKDELVCSVRCSEHSDCTEPGYRCAIYDSEGDNTVRACVPLPPTYCLECESEGEPDHSICQGYGARCVNTGDDGFRCGRDCSAGDASCPPDAECLDFFVDGETVSQCVPKGGATCSDCIDRDGDGYGIAGDNCPYEGFDCDDSDPYINPGATERCDNIDWDCDGNAHNGFDLENDPNHCGGCAISCHRDHMEGACQDAECGFGACDDKFYDLNENWADGCEYYCPYEDFDIIDEPDALNTDTNCDGITGDVERAVFVSSAGLDDNPGTKDAPVRTLQRGQDIALAESKTQILVSSGNFELQEAGGAPFDMVGGVSIYGGYHPDTWQRSPGVLKTNLRANAPIGLRIGDVNHRTVLSGVAVHGESFTSGGHSSIAILLDDAGQDQRVELRYIEVSAGNGGTGTHGTDGQNGEPGGKGSDHTDTNSMYGVPGAKPGPNDCWTAGGDGGASNGIKDECWKESNERGRPGASPAPGVPGGTGGAHGDNNCDWGVGNCGGQKTSGAGGDGGNGGTGLIGPSADAPTDGAGSFSAINFTAASGGDGHIGTPGGGGGGGGGAGTSKWLCGGGRAGTGGAGGGGGGCPGTGGTGGGGGGGSFGLVLRNSVPLLTSVQIRQGRGGQGGNGGVGGKGGDGGKGGKGSIRHRSSQTSSSHGKSGDGGKGGNGGTGSGGAGGCGGPSIGIALIGLSESDVDISDATITGGTPGQPGSGGKGPDPQGYGPDGCQGASADIHSY